MINVTEEMYRSLAENLIAEVEELSGDFYNGCVEHDSSEYYSELKCSLILFRPQTATHHCTCPNCAENTPGEIDKIVPVWWEFALYSERGEEYSNFSWKEFATYLKPYTAC